MHAVEGGKGWLEHWHKHTRGHTHSTYRYTFVYTGYTTRKRMNITTAMNLVYCGRDGCIYQRRYYYYIYMRRPSISAAAKKKEKRKERDIENPTLQLRRWRRQLWMMREANRCPADDSWNADAANPIQRRTLLPPCREMEYNFAGSLFQ